MLCSGACEGSDVEIEADIEAISNVSTSSLAEVAAALGVQVAVLKRRSEDPMVTEESGLTSSAELIDMLERLIEAWDGPREQVEFYKRGEKPKLDRFVVITALASHVHRLADSALLLTHEGHNIQTIPLIRAAYETALTTQWLAQAGDGIEAVMNKWMRSRQVLGEEMSKMSLEHLQEIGADILAQDLVTARRTASEPQGRRFQRLCEDFRGGDELYVHYRGMSAYVHPSERVADEYASVGNDGSIAFQSAPKFNQKDSSGFRAWLFMLTWSVLLAARAYDFIDKSKTSRSMLRDFGRQLGVPSELHLTEKAGRRIRLGDRRG